jgi:hypothetical protein
LGSPKLFTLLQLFQPANSADAKQVSKHRAIRKTVVSLRLFGDRAGTRQKPTEKCGGSRGHFCRVRRDSGEKT